MKTKNIFKTLAFAMLMPTMLLTTSCSSEDDLVNNTAAESTVNKGYTLPVTVSVTRQGDEATTRTMYNESTKELEFSAGDKLFVRGEDTGGAGKFAGTLTWQSGGTFSGTVTTENSYSGDADALFTAGGSSTAATLLPAGYESYGYLKIDNEGYNATLKETALKSFATSKKLAVEQLSFESGSYTSGTGFALCPSNAILNFTITDLAASTKVTATLGDGESLRISGDVTTDAEGKAIFAMGVFGIRDLNELSLNVGGKPIPLVSESKQLSAGEIYNITRSAPPSVRTLAEATAADRGKIAGADGNIYANAAAATTAGTTAVAKIVYVGTTGDATYSHGLALALTDEGNMDRETAGTTCSNKNSSTPVTGAKWLLASKDQWNYMINAAGGYEALRDGFSGITGASNLQSKHYWSSTEWDEYYTWDYGFGIGDWYSDLKYRVDLYVRACLAF